MTRGTVNFVHLDKKKSKVWKMCWRSSDNIRPSNQLHTLILCNSGQYFTDNKELFPIWHHSFHNVARSWHLGVNSFIVRCHVTIKKPMNGQAVAGKTPAIQQLYLLCLPTQIHFLIGGKDVMCSVSKLTHSLHLIRLCSLEPQQIYEPAGVKQTILHGLFF